MPSFFILNFPPEIAEIFLCFDSPDLELRSQQEWLESFCLEPGQSHSDLPGDSQVVLKNLKTVHTDWGSKCPWIYTDLYQLKIWYTISQLQSYGGDLLLLSVKKERDYIPRSSGPSVQLVTLYCGV